MTWRTRALLRLRRDLSPLLTMGGDDGGHLLEEGGLAVQPQTQPPPAAASAGELILPRGMPGRIHVEGGRCFHFSRLPRVAGDLLLPRLLGVRHLLYQVQELIFLHHLFYKPNL